MTRLVLLGQDTEILPLLTRLRLNGKEEVRGLIPVGDCKDLELYAEIARIPILSVEEWRGWKHHLDFLVAEEPVPVSLGELPTLSPADAIERFLSEVEEPAADPLPKAPEIREEAPSVAEPRIRYDFSGFAHELRREIRRSRRYHLGFCFTLFRVVGESGESLATDQFLKEPLLSLPARVGRKTDSWGISPEGILLHLAPEIQEQARLLRRRLSLALEDQVREMPGGPWRCQSAQALYPQDGERASQLIRHAMDALERQS